MMNVRHHEKTNTDPVCGMYVHGETALKEEYEGREYNFCAEGCREKFTKDPERYASTDTGEKKGWFGRFIERLARANDEEFGPKGPRCCQ